MNQKNQLFKKAKRNQQDTKPVIPTEFVIPAGSVISTEFVIPVHAGIQKNLFPQKSASGIQNKPRGKE